MIIDFRNFAYAPKNVNILLIFLAIVSEQIYAYTRTLLRHEYVYGSGGKTPRKFNCLSVSYTQPIWTAW